MKKLGAGFAVLGVFLMIAVGCNDSSSANDSSPADDRLVGTAQNLDDYARQFKLGMTEQEVIDLLGEPTDRMNMGEGTIRFEYANIYVADISVTLVDGKVTASRMTSRKR
ncbi:MAG: hypothetical protein IH944_01420 [Armatimonadetes bacterium]|nr:hypothetical protein [Armatimonadota bacterium]